MYVLRQNFQTLFLPVVATCCYRLIDIYSSCVRPEHEPLDPMHLKMENYMKHNVNIFAVALVLWLPKHLNMYV